MTDQELITKLNKLHSVRPDDKWLKDNRELLLGQISNSGAVDLPFWKVFLIDLSSTMKAISQPAYALGVFVLLLLFGSLFSQQYLAQAKPNESLYIARILSERVRLNTTFNAVQRNSLALHFASNHAHDISEVLANPQFNSEENKEQVAKLNNSFQEEIKTVKSHINNLSSKTTKSDLSSRAEQTASATDNVIMAESVKDKQGIKLLEAKPLVNTESTSSSSTPENSSSTLLTASTTASSSDSLTPVDSSSDSKLVNKIVDEANKLFKQKNYTEAADKLQEIDKIIK